MRIIHTVRVSGSSAQRSELEALGMPAKIVSLAGKAVSVAFSVGEDDPKWALLERWLSGRKNVRHHIHTEFSEADDEAAMWLLLYTWEHGYPQPEGHWGYREVTYDLTDWCSTCWTGKRQKAPFRMKGEPRWGRHNMMMLNWVGDEVFVTPDLLRRVFVPRGLTSRPVLDKDGKELETVVQLAIEEELDVVTDGLEYEQCPTCGRNKYFPVTRGAFPPFVAEPHHPLVRTRQHFGHGHAGNKTMVVSQAIRQTLLKENVRGLRLIPMGTIASQ